MAAESATAAWTRRATLPATLFVQAAASASVIAPTVAAPLLLARLQIGTFAVGLFVALVYLGAMFASPLGAAFVHRLGPIRASQLALGCATLGLALMTLPSVPLATLGALVIGLGYGPITPASSLMLARTTEPRNYALVFSIKQTGVPLGGVVAGLMVPPLVVAGGAVGALAGTALLCIVGIVVAQPLSRELDRDRDAGGAWPRLAQLTAPVRYVAVHAQLRELALCTLIFSMVQVSLTSYLVSFLTGDLHWTLLAAGAALSASQVAGVAGRIVWGMVADRLLGARRMLIALAAAMALCSAAMPLLGQAAPTTTVVVLLCLYGATAVGWNGVYLATVARMVPNDEAATATAGTLFFTFFGVVVGPPIVGAASSALGGLGPAFALLVLPLAWSLRVLARARWNL